MTPKPRPKLHAVVAGGSTPCTHRPTRSESGMDCFDVRASFREGSQLTSTSTVSMTGRKRRLMPRTALRLTRQNRHRSHAFSTFFVSTIVSLAMDAMAPFSAISRAGFVSGLSPGVERGVRLTNTDFKSDFEIDVTFNDEGREIDLSWMSADLFETDGVLSQSALEKVGVGIQNFLETELTVLHEPGGQAFPFTYESVLVSVISQETIYKENDRRRAEVELEHRETEYNEFQRRIKDDFRGHMSRSRSFSMGDDDNDEKRTRDGFLRRGSRQLATVTGTAVTFGGLVTYDTNPAPGDSEVNKWVQSIVESQMENLLNNITATGDPELQNVNRATVAEVPSASPSVAPSAEPSALPSIEPSSVPSVVPSMQPSAQPSVPPSSSPSRLPSVHPSAPPSTQPSVTPSLIPSTMPSVLPTVPPSLEPSVPPTLTPSSVPTPQPSELPSLEPSVPPSSSPSTQPSAIPTQQPSHVPSRDQPSAIPTQQPSHVPSRDQPSLTPTSSPSPSSDESTTDIGIRGDSAAQILRNNNEGDSPSIVIASAAVIGAAFIALGSILYIRKLRGAPSDDEMQEKGIAGGKIRKYRSRNAYEDLESDRGSPDHKNRTILSTAPSAFNSAAKRWLDPDKGASPGKSNIGAQLEIATRASLEAESASSNSSCQSDVYTVTPERSPADGVHTATLASDQAIEVSLSSEQYVTYNSPEGGRSFVTPLNVARSWLNWRKSDDGNSSNAARVGPEAGAFNFTRTTNLPTTDTVRSEQTSRASTSVTDSKIGGTVTGQDGSSISSLTSGTLGSSILTRNKFNPQSAYGISVAELNKEGTEAFEVSSSFDFSSDGGQTPRSGVSSSVKTPQSQAGTKSGAKKMHQEHSSPHSSEWVDHGKPPIPNSGSGRKETVGSVDISNGITPVKRNGVGRIGFSSKGTVLGKLSQEEFEATWDEELPYSWDPVKDNPNAVVKGGVVAHSSPERFQSLVGSVAQNGEVHFQKNQGNISGDVTNAHAMESTFRQRSMITGSLRIGTGEKDTEVTMQHHPEITPSSMATSTSPLSMISDIVQDGSFPKFEMTNGEDTNLLPPRPDSRQSSSFRSAGNTTGDDSSAFQTCNTPGASSCMHPLDWSNRASDVDQSDTSTLSENGQHSLHTNERKIEWGDHRHAYHLRRVLAERSAQSRDTQTGMEDDIISPRTYGDTTNTDTNEGNSQGSSHASSKQLINDLVWLEKKIADVRSAAQLQELEITDSLSYDSQFSPSSADDSLTSDGKAPIMQSIVCRDCYAPPGKLQIVILSTRDGPAVHSVKEGSSLEGQLFAGDLIIAVDNVDTRTYSAEHVMKVMQAKSEFERKITVLHFEDED